jgi:hypothetical protein
MSPAVPGRRFGAAVPGPRRVAIISGPTGGRRCLRSGALLKRGLGVRSSWSRSGSFNGLPRPGAARAHQSAWSLYIVLGHTPRRRCQMGTWGLGVVSGSASKIAEDRRYEFSSQKLAILAVQRGSGAHAFKTLYRWPLSLLRCPPPAVPGRRVDVTVPEPQRVAIISGPTGSEGGLG